MVALAAVAVEHPAYSLTVLLAVRLGEKMVAESLARLVQRIPELVVVEQVGLDHEPPRTALGLLGQLAALGWLLLNTLRRNNQWNGQRH
jgi:hypothetical protein